MLTTTTIMEGDDDICLLAYSHIKQINVNISIV